MFVIKLSKENADYYLIKRGEFAHATTKFVEEATKFNTEDEAIKLKKKLSLEVIWDEVFIEKI